MLNGQAHTERYFRDTLQIGSKSQTGSGWGSNPATATWSYDTTNTVKCFVDETAHRESGDGAEAPLSDAKIYVPRGTAITGKQRVKVTHIARVAQDSQRIYAVMGNPKIARNMLVLTCSLVTGESLV